MKKISKKMLLAMMVVLAVLCMAFLGKKENKADNIKSFTAFIAVTGASENNESRLKKKIAEKTGAEVDVERLSGQTAEEKIKSMIASGKYPDFIDGSNATDLLIEEKALIPLDEYLPKYPGLKKYLTDTQWNSLRKADGHIYFIPPYGVINGHSTSTMPSGEAFWIQKRVLAWAGYPKVKTLDEYFDLIERYQKAVPVTNGESTIGFEILCDDWRYFCLENPPMFLAGYPNNGCAIVDPKTGKTGLYDTLPEAKQYYKKLNEIYNKGLIDKETFTLSYNQYIQRLASGRVLGMVDQQWEIIDALSELRGKGMDECSYVPLPITANENIEGNYLCAEPNINTASGIGISVSCKDVDGALTFLEGLLSPEVMKLRSWGEEGIDYEVNSKGLFYRNKEEAANWSNGEYLEENRCPYSQFPSYEGLLADNKNTVAPSEQPDIFYSSLSEYDKKLMDAYGYKTWKDFLGEEKEGAAWYPLYSVTSDWKSDTDYGRAKEAMQRVKRKWLPILIMSEEGKFEDMWEQYMTEYDKEVDTKAYLDRLDLEVKKRIEASGQ
ncbi:carbohydrate ABC transporter substrate-binding protein, CUT1 family [Lachnospiraceae bacterium KH1T2]|nr:carbohydrate ABC transporter substrate-binding protein, CUT1 family [Lachnospiraceae bacterium KH1T2]